MNNQSMSNVEILDADDVISCEDPWVMSNNTYLIPNPNIIPPKKGFYGHQW